MTDKIKLKADKFVNDKKLKLNYIKPKDLKILLAEFCEEQIAELKAECDLAIEGRDVKIIELETRCNELFLQTCEQAEKIKELKDYRLTTVAKQQTDMSKYALNLEHKLSWYDDQLTKAKGIIDEFVFLLTHPRTALDTKTVMQKAEQFLNSEVEK